jgi:hypothetical protein
MDLADGFIRAGIGAVAEAAEAAAAVVSEVHLVVHQHWKKLHSPESLLLLSAMHTLLQALSLTNPKHAPL